MGHRHSEQHRDSQVQRSMGLRPRQHSILSGEEGDLTSKPNSYSVPSPLLLRMYPLIFGSAIALNRPGVTHSFLYPEVVESVLVAAEGKNSTYKAITSSTQATQHTFFTNTDASPNNGKNAHGMHRTYGIYAPGSSV